MKIKHEPLAFFAMKQMLSLLSLVLFLGVCKAQEPRSKVLDRPNTAVVNVNYVGNRAPLLPAHFIKLPVGSIQPEGWVRQFLSLQRDGLTGHLGEISAWLSKEGNAWLSKDGKGDFGWEEVPYWLKGYGNLAYILKDPKMIAETQTWINAVLSSQREDGYFGPYTEKNGCPDLWGNMIMLWCMQSYYEHSQDQRVIPFMTKYFEWEMKLPEDKFLKDYWENSRGGDNLYSVYWLYNITGDAFLLDLGEKLHRNTANWEMAGAGKLPNWHNVNFAQCFREPATYYLQSHKIAEQEATYADFKLMHDKYGQVPGGMFGADENAREGYHDPRQGVEVCGMVEQMASDELLLRETGDPSWADHCEDVAFNTYPAAVMPDFKSLRYITSPNMIQADSKNHHPGIDNSGPFLMMNPFSSRCCQHNHAQGWPYYSENMWLATPDNGLLAALYGESSVTAKVANHQTVSLKQSTHYPFDESIKIEVTKGNKIHFPLYLRIPQWCDRAEVKVNGESIDAKIEPSKYVCINRTWKVGDVVVLTLPMKLTLRTWAQNGNSVSVNYGPVTYSLKIKERYVKEDSKETAIGDSKWQKTADPLKWPSYEIYADSPWNYALVLDKNNLEKSFHVVKKAWPKDNYPFTNAAAPIEIEAQGVRVPQWKMDETGLCGLVPQSPVAVEQVLEKITLVPMGGARLRISAFPTIQ